MAFDLVINFKIPGTYQRVSKYAFMSTLDAACIGFLVTVKPFLSGKLNMDKKPEFNDKW